MVKDVMKINLNINKFSLFFYAYKFLNSMQSIVRYIWMSIYLNKQLKNN